MSVPKSSYFVASLKVFLLFTLASVCSSGSFQISNLNFRTRDRNFDSKVSNSSSFKFFSFKQSKPSDVTWLRRKALFSSKQSTSDADGKTLKTTEFQAETYLPAKSTQVDKNEPETLQMEEDPSEDFSREDSIETANPEDAKELEESPETEKYEVEPASITSLITETVSKILEPSPKAERRGDKMAMKQMKMQMKMNKKQMMLQTATNMMAMKMMMKMKMKKMKYDMKKKKMKMKYDMKKEKEKKKICKACNKCGGGGGKAEPELVKIDRIKLKKVPMPVDYKSYKKISRGGKGGYQVATKFRGGYSFPEPMFNPEPELLALPEPEIFTKKQLVSYDYQYHQYPDDYNSDYYGPDYAMPNMTMMMTMMAMMTTTTPAPPAMIAPAAFVTFPPVAVNTGK